MPSLKSTKRRILSVKSTQKITKAMKLVSSAKYAKAHHAIENAKPYGESISAMVQSLARLADVEQVPLLQQRPEKKVLLILLMADRGLCGALNSNLLKAGHRFLNDKNAKGCAADLYLWGKRSYLLANQRKEKVVDRREKMIDRPKYAVAKENAEHFALAVRDGKYDGVYVGFSEFKNVLTQTPTFLRLLPIAFQVGQTSVDPATAAPDFIAEPEATRFLESLLVKQAASELFRAMLTSSASEHAARMTAMDNATNNADDVIKNLTLEYNRARQAAITKELIEITSGAEAL